MAADRLPKGLVKQVALLWRPRSWVWPSAASVPGRSDYGATLSSQSSKETDKQDMMAIYEFTQQETEEQETENLHVLANALFL